MKKSNGPKPCARACEVKWNEICSGFGSFAHEKLLIILKAKKETL
jgi:hypothetical protein